MNILMLNYEYPPIGGGAGNATFYLLREFAKHSDVEIDLVTSSDGAYREEDISGNIKIHFLDIGKKGNYLYQSNRDLISYSCKAYEFSKKLVNREKYDLVHAFFGVPCGFIAMKLGLPYIVSLRGSDVPFYNQRFRMLDKILFQRLSRKIWDASCSVVTNSEGLKELALKTNPQQKISIIHNGVDVEEFTPTEECDKQGPIKLISTGRLIQRKGYEYLMKALKSKEGFTLDIIGDGNLKGELERLSRECRIPVKFLGRKDHSEIKKHLQDADIFILPSLNEGMSNSILEAMACGLAVITTDVGGAKELLRDNGIVVERASVLSIRDALDVYYRDRSLIKRHGEVSRRIAEKMGWENVSRAYIEKYRRIYGYFDHNSGA